MQPNIEDVIQKAIGELESAGIAYPRRDANHLMEKVLEKDRAFIIAHGRDKITEIEHKKFKQLILRRLAREPIQHITGLQEFWGREFDVTPEVLIPRPETEIIVESSLNLFSPAADFRFLELGVGSGAIAVSILADRLNACALAMDISLSAIGIARRNAAKFGVSGRIEMFASDLFDGLKGGKFDLIVANPPYISASDIDQLEPEVKDHDPLIALTDGANGLSLIKRIIEEAPVFLNSKAVLLMEIGIDQDKEIAKYFSNNNWSSFEILSDLQGIPRTVKAMRN